jgi:tRNA threonylcarbamoyladenosine biosynthesis protein TsaE
MKDGWELITHDPTQTRALGRLLGESLTGRDFLALSGPLGAGKTQFIKGVAAGLAVPADEPIVSPTFVLIREYRGRLTLYHIDAYRLGGTEELFSLGLDEMVAEPEAVVAIEWADRTPEAMPQRACRVELAHLGGDQRRVRIDWANAERLAALRRRWDDSVAAGSKRNRG